MTGVTRALAAPVRLLPILCWRTRFEPATLAVAAVAAVATLAFSAVGLLRHHLYSSTAMDLAFFDQVVWNTSQGRWFETSFTPYNFLGQHVEPILLLFALLYRITPAPEWLILVQALAAGMAAMLLYFVARRRLERPWLAALVAAAFLLSPSLHDALSFDYHSETLTPLFVFGGVLLLSGRRWAGVLVLLSTLLLKEDAALLLIGLAVPLWLQRERRAAFTVASAGLVWISVVVLLLMPAVRGAQFDLAARYRHLGGAGDAASLAAAIATDPDRAFDHVVSRATLNGVARQLFTQGGVGLLAPAWLLAAAPNALLQWLSQHEPQRELRIQYGMQVLPLASLATVEGFRRIERMRRFDARLLPLVATAFAVCAVVGAVWSSPAWSLSRGSYRGGSERAAVSELVARVPPEASVSAQSNLAPHLSQRPEIHEFPNLNGARYVVLDLNGVVAGPYKATFAIEVAALGERGYRLIWSRGGCRLYERMSR